MLVKKVRILNIYEARNIALVQGIVPFKSKDKKKTDDEEIQTIGFAKIIKKDQTQLSWTDLETLLKEKNMVICEIGGYMKILDSQRIIHEEE